MHDMHTQLVRATHGATVYCTLYTHDIVLFERKRETQAQAGVYTQKRLWNSQLELLLRFKTERVQSRQESYGAYRPRPAAQLLSVHPG